MSGRKQHYIPQLFLRNFRIPKEVSTGKEPKIWTVARDRDPFASAIHSTAAQAEFYSGLTESSARTLDDTITEYEGRLKLLLDALLEDDPSSIESEAAAEVVAHLITRSKHLRSTFRHALSGIGELAVQMVSSPDMIASYVGLDNSVPTDLFRNNESIKKIVEQLIQVGLSHHVAEDVAFRFAKENFASAHRKNATLVRHVIEGFFLQAGSQAASGHRKVLDGVLVPPGQVKRLASLQWRRVKSQHPLILPDCIAISISEMGCEPLLVGDGSPLLLAVMPLDSENILVGRAVGTDKTLPADLNRAFAECSESAFYCGVITGEIQALRPFIASRGMGAIDRALAAATDTLNTPVHVTTEVGGVTPEAKFEDVTPDRDWKIEVRFSPDIAEVVRSSSIEEIRHQGSDWFSLSPLRALTLVSFTREVAIEALPGLELAMPDTDVTRVGVTIDEAKLSFLISCYPVFPGDELHPSSGDLECSFWLMFGFGRIAGAEKVERELKGFYSGRFGDWTLAERALCIEAAWSSYFAARICVERVPMQTWITRAAVLHSLRAREAAVVAARQRYRTNGDLDSLVATVFGHLKPIFASLGAYAGACDAGGVSECLPFDGEQGAALNNWWATFHRELRSDWDGARWSSPGRFEDLSRHVDRLLWSMGMFPWRNGDDWIWEIPLISDASYLRELQRESEPPLDSSPPSPA